MRKLPPAGATERDVHQAINALIEGRSNAVGTVTLTPGATTTVVESPTINGNAIVILSPRTANAATALATTYVSVSPSGGTFTLTHASAASVDRSFGYLVIGG